MPIFVCSILRLYGSTLFDVMIRGFRANKLITNNTMKHNFMKFKSMVWGILFSVSLTIGAVSCVSPYDDTDLINEINKLKGELAELKQSVETELTSLRDLIKGYIFVVDVVSNNDGSVEVKLSNDSSFMVYPKGDKVPVGLVTVIEDEDGVLCWAQYDDKGVARLIKIGGKNVPVAGEQPEVRVAEDGVSIEISFDGGATWVTTGYNESAADKLIADIEVVFSDWQVDGDGNALPLYCVLTLADGSQVKVGMNTRIILDTDIVYATAGSKGTISAMAEGAVDFVTTTPEGWSCDAELDSATSTITLTVDAPTNEAISAGKAVADGVVKLYVVFDNGLSAIASIAVSTSPIFVTYDADAITITTGGGVDKLVCGLVPTSSFDAAVVAEEANKVLAGGTSTMVYVVEFGDEKSVTLTAEQINPSMEYGVEHTFWYAIPYTQEGQEVIDATAITTAAYTTSHISFQCVTPDYFDVEVALSIAGSAGYKIGCEPSSTYKNSAVLKKFEDDAYVLREDGDYSGSLVTLLGVDEDYFVPGTEYTFWYLECGGKSSVSASDITKWKFTTKAFEQGGDLELTASDINVKHTSFSLNLDSVGHIYLYYHILKSSDINSSATDDDLMTMLLNDGTACKTDTALTVENKNAESTTAYTVLAVGVDANGKYGKLFKKEIATTNLEFNDLKVKVEVVGEVCLNKASLKATAEGAVGFAYMYVSNRSTEWLYVWQKDKNRAAEFMAGNLDCSYVHKVDAGGNIELRGLDLATADDLKVIYGDAPADDENSDNPQGRPIIGYEDKYDEPAGSVVFVGALDSKGIISSVEVVTLNPKSEYGTIVQSTDAKWSSSKPAIKVYNTATAGSYMVEWYLTPAAGYTAYSYAAKSCKNMGITTVESLIDLIIANTGIQNVENSLVQYGTRCTYHPSGSYMYISHTWSNANDLNGDNFPQLDEHVSTYMTGLEGAHCRGVGDSSDFYIYTTWVDADGNFYEPSVYNPEHKNDDGSKGSFVDLEF